MALRALLLKKKADERRKALTEAQAKAKEARDKITAMQEREAELEAAINEMTEETSAEDRAAVQEEVDQFEVDKKALEEEADAAEAEAKKVEAEVAETEKELEELEAKQEEKPAEPEPATAEKSEEKGEDAMNRSDLMNIITRENVKNYLSEVRSCIREKRALQNVGLTIPEDFLGFIRQNIESYSKLYRHVRVRPLSGDGRVVVMGTIPEAIWTDCCANLNELNLKFNDEEFACWKVGGYYAVCNANLEDSDLALASEILTALGQAIGLALDKAILYGTGNRMPLGIVPRLVQTEKPDSYSVTARDWEDLHTSNVKTINSAGMTAAQLFAAIVTDFGAAKGKYSRGEKVWVMNEATYTALTAAAVTLNVAGAIVSGIGATMPVVGGIIEVLDFIPDNIIIAGYFDLYTLAERAGAAFATSEHVRFLADQTVMKGTARYDGKPVIAEGFVAMSLANTAISGTAVTFAPDEANTAEGIVLNKTTATVTAAAGTQHTVTLKANTIPAGQAITWTSADTSLATVSSAGVVTGVAATTGVVITAASGVANAFCTVTVTN